jgi:hypothetical protein
MTRSVILLLLALAVSALASPLSSKTYYPSTPGSVFKIGNIVVEAGYHNESNDAAGSLLHEISGSPLSKRWAPGDIFCWDWVANDGSTFDQYTADQLSLYNRQKSQNNYLSYVSGAPIIL